MLREIKLVKRFEPTIYDEPRVKIIMTCGHKQVCFADTEPEIGEAYRCEMCCKIRLN